MSNQHLIHCPHCHAKIDEREMKDGELIKKHCDKCEYDFWALGEMEIKSLIEYKKAGKTD